MRAHAFTTRASNQGYFSLSGGPIFRLGGTREKAARGFAIGLACCFYPTFGLGGFLAGLCRSSMVAGFVEERRWPSSGHSFFI